MEGSMRVISLLLFLFMILPSSLCFALDNKECLGCHGTRDILKMTADERSGMVTPAPPDSAPKKDKFGLFLDNDKFASSVHGRLRCTDCHRDVKGTPHAQRLRPVECDGCHQATASEYAESHHAKGGATSCLDCHNPHDAVSYKKLSLDERSAICLKCHEKGGHPWLPERELHFSSLECTVCHAPRAKKVFTLYFSPAKKMPLTYNQIKGVAASGEDMAKELGVSGNNLIELGGVEHFRSLLDKAGISSVRLTGEGLVSEPHHGFVARVTEARDCTLCHSAKSNFFSTVTLKMPSKKGWQTFRADQEIVAKMNLIPAGENYFTTVHAQGGVECIECHGYQTVVREADRFKVKEMKELVCGTRCHTDIMDEYKGSVHYKAQEHFCLDCHKPHQRTPYARLNAAERRAICTRCHKDTERQHKWQSEEALHCKFVECTMCHSPRAQKGLVLYLRGSDGQGRERPLDYEDVAELGGAEGQDMITAIDRDKTRRLDEGELALLIKSLNDAKRLKKKGFEKVDLDENLLTLRPFHDFTEKMKEAKDCSLCHSSEPESLARCGPACARARRKVGSRSYREGCAARLSLTAGGA